MDETNRINADTVRDLRKMLGMPKAHGLDCIVVLDARLRAFHDKDWKCPYCAQNEIECKVGGAGCAAALSTKRT